MKDFERYNSLLIQSADNKMGTIAPVVMTSASFRYSDTEEAR